MIGYCPAAAPEELLYSALARCWDTVQFRSSKEFSEALFGAHTSTASIDLPTRLEALIGHTPPGWAKSAASLIANHTLLPYYARIASPDIVGQAHQRMRTGVGWVHPLLSLPTSGITAPKCLQLCIRCAEDDCARLGEPVWRRVHQLPGVFVCPQHGELLVEGTPRRPRRDVRRYHSAFDFWHGQAGEPSDLLSRRLRTQGAPQAALMFVAKQSQWLLSAPLPAEGERIDVPARYAHLLGELGLRTKEGRTDVASVRRALRDHFGNEWLDSVGLGVHEKVRGHDWVGYLLRRGMEVSHPLRHILLWSALGTTAERFLTLSLVEGQRARRNRRPELGAAAIKCPNPACPAPFGHVEAIGPTRESRSASRQQWRCQRCHCDFSATASGGRPVLHWRGPLWDAAFRAAVENSSLSTSRIMRDLRMSHDGVLESAARLRVWREAWGTPPVSSALDQASRNLLARTEQYRERWATLRQANPQASRTELIRSDRHAYSHLQRYDRDWLAEHQPPKLKRAGNPSRASVDWDGRDVQTAERIELFLCEFVQRDAKPERITRRMIARSIEHGTWLQKPWCLEKMPRSQALLAARAEAVDAFVRRRIRYVATQYAHEGVVPCRSVFVERAGITFKHRSRYSAAVAEALNGIRVQVSGPSS
jgi:hypothetical protein